MRTRQPSGPVLAAGTGDAVSADLRPASVTAPTAPTVRRPLRMVVVAASAGGVEALSVLVHALPATFNVPVVVAMHRSESAPSVLAGILARAGSLPVKQLTRPGERPEPGVVYLAPTTRHLVITEDGVFGFHDGECIHHLRSSADPLFASAARQLDGCVAGVVLTGMGRNATDGVLAVKEHGGVVIAQDRATSRFFSMPKSAIETGAVDFVLPLPEIAPMLARFARDGMPSPATPARMTLPSTLDDPRQRTTPA